MKAFTVFLASLSFVVPMHAGIGESVKKVEARYGKPQRVLHERGSFRELGYGYRGFMVGVGYLNGISKREGFARPDLPKLSAADVQQILRIAAGNGMSWEPLDSKEWKAILPRGGERYWLRSDKVAIASLSAEGNFVLTQDRKFREPLK
jgi:hypothetical protein